MLINSWGQPTVIHRGEPLKNIEEFVKAPLLLCRQEGLLNVILPLNWCGCVYKSELIQDEFIESSYKMPSNGHYTIKNMVAYERIDTILPNGNALKLTLVPLDAKNQNFMFIIQDRFVTSIVTDNFTSAAFKIFIQNKLLRKVIGDEIDVLYINDTVFMHQISTLRPYPSELLLRSMINILQPRFIRGIGEAELPAYLKFESNKIHN